MDVVRLAGKVGEKPYAFLLLLLSRPLAKNIPYTDRSQSANGWHHPVKYQKKREKSRSNGKNRRRRGISSGRAP
jgi:hypothetical protein